MKRVCGLVLSLGILFLTAAAAGEPIPPDAGVHFRQGLALADLGRFEEASIEFESAYAISPRPAVLYNIGMAHAASRRASLAVKAFKQYLQASGTETEPLRLKEAREQIQKLEGQLAILKLRVEPPTAEIRIDGRGIEHWGELTLDPGKHFLSVSAQGYASLERELVIAVGERADLSVALESTPCNQLKLLTGFLSIKCEVPDVEVIADNVVIATTPRVGPIILQAGERRIGFRRLGYRDNYVSVNIKEATSSSINCGVQPDLVSSPSSLAVVKVRSNVDEASLFADGRQFVGSIALPLGRHNILTEKSGYQPLLTSIVVRSGQRLEVTANLTPTPEKLRELERARVQRLRLSIISASSGLLLAGVTTALIIDNHARYDRWKQRQVILDEQWRSSAPDANLAARQADNDTTAKRVRLQDEVAVGMAVASIACFIASTLTWVLNSEQPTRRSTWQFRSQRAEFSTAW